MSVFFFSLDLVVVFVCFHHLYLLLSRYRTNDNIFIASGAGAGCVFVVYLVFVFVTSICYICIEDEDDIISVSGAAFE